jgi:hypothetical protein
MVQEAIDWVQDPLNPAKIPIIGPLGKEIFESTGAAWNDPNALTISRAVGAYSQAVLLALGPKAIKARLATKSANKGGLNLFKRKDKTSTKATGWKEGDSFLRLPDNGGAKANWKRNSGHLREEMGKRRPIYDSYRDPATGKQIPTGGFLNAERKLLESRGWKYNSSTGAYHPPSN